MQNAITKLPVFPLLASVSHTLGDGAFAFEDPSLKNKVHPQLPQQTVLLGLNPPKLYGLTQSCHSSHEWTRRENDFRALQLEFD